MSASPVAHKVTCCRLCGSDRLDTIIDFGTPYISDFLLPGTEGTRAPLHVVRCETCGLVQLKHTVDRDLLYSDRYWYRSGMNESMVEALRDVVRAAGVLEVGDRVLDIGANDGTLLSMYPEGVDTNAVEPCLQFGNDLLHQVHNTSIGFWPDVTHDAGGDFRVITTVACFYDSHDPHTFVEAIKGALRPDGVWIVQFQDADAILRHDAVDYFCHEHLCLWDIESFHNLLAQHDLIIRRIGASDINGGSTRFVVEHGKSYRYRRHDPEKWAGRWKTFALRAEERRSRARFTLINLASQGKLVLGVAASTKANTILQWYGITPDLLPAIVERAPEKIGKITVGSNIPIISEDEGRAMKPDYYLALAWHFLDGLRARAPDTPFFTLLPAVDFWSALERN